MAAYARQKPYFVGDPVTGCVWSTRPPTARGMFVDRRPQRLGRIVWVAEVGPLPDGARLRRTCDNPACVAPAHREVF